MSEQASLSHPTQRLLSTDVEGFSSLAELVPIVEPEVTGA
jgi:hypothetical protein